MEKTIKYILIGVVLLLITYSSVSTKQLVDTRRHLDTAREQLVRATEYNRGLTERLGSIQANATKLGELTNRNVSTVRECVELVEEIRVGVKEMEDIIYGGNTSDSYYDWLDSILRDEQLME